MLMDAVLVADTGGGSNGRNQETFRSDRRQDAADTQYTSLGAKERPTNDPPFPDIGPGTAIDPQKSSAVKI